MAHHGDMACEYRTLDADELGRLRELDRSEHITTVYTTDGTTLVPHAVDWHDPGWLDGSGDHSFAHMIEFCRGHLEAGARALGCFVTDGPLVGLGVMTLEIEPGVAQLAFLHVSCAYRRLGIASELVDRLVDWAGDEGAREIYVSATPSESAVSFYQRAGFRITDRPNPALLALEPEDIHLRRPR